MLYNSQIINLYHSVIDADIFHYSINQNDIQNGIASMKDVYMPSQRLCSERSKVANFNDVSHRCAYLHKYACFHTALVRDIMSEAVQANFRLFYDIIFSNESFNVTCLGGGPGNDIIGVLAALHHSFSFFNCASTVVDYMVEWQYSFQSILRELGSGMYGAFGNNVSHFLNWRYLQANLLKDFSSEVFDSIANASLITMVKFVSATACMDTESMISNVFAAMKPGGLILFIDNDGGGFDKLIDEAAIKFDFISIFHIKHYNYEAKDLKTFRFSYMSCARTVVTVNLLQKPLFYDYDYRQPLLDNFRYMPPTRRFNSSCALTPLVHIANTYSVDENINVTNQFLSPAEAIPQLSPPRPSPSPLLATPLYPPVNPIIHTPIPKTRKNIRKRFARRLKNIKVNVKRKLKKTFNVMRH